MLDSIKNDYKSGAVPYIARKIVGYSPIFRRNSQDFSDAPSCLGGGVFKGTVSCKDELSKRKTCGFF